MYRKGNVMSGGKKRPSKFQTEFFINTSKSVMQDSQQNHPQDLVTTSQCTSSSIFTLSWEELLKMTQIKSMGIDVHVFKGLNW